MELQVLLNWLTVLGNLTEYEQIGGGTQKFLGPRGVKYLNTGLCLPFRSNSPHSNAYLQRPEFKRWIPFPYSSFYFLFEESLSYSCEYPWHCAGRRYRFGIQNLWLQLSETLRPPFEHRFWAIYVVKFCLLFYKPCLWWRRKPMASGWCYYATTTPTEAIARCLATTRVGSVCRGRSR